MSPDSRLSEWRTSRGTRGLVTTLEDSTGSVGDSSAPSSSPSVQLNPASQWPAAAMITAVSGIASTSLRSGRRQWLWSISASTSRPSRNRITISATVARSVTNPLRALSVSTPKPPWPSAKPASTNAAVSVTKLRRATPEISAPATSNTPSTSTVVPKWCDTAASGAATGVSVAFTGLECQVLAGSGPRDEERQLQVSVLGKSPSWQDAAGACSGYLVEQDGYRLLLDCGNGVFSKLRGVCDYVDVDAVLISHMHADHFLDLIPYSYALSYAPRQQPVAVGGWPGTDTPARPALYVPHGGPQMFRRIVSCWGQEDLVDGAFAVQEYGAQDELTLGPVRCALL